MELSSIKNIISNLCRNVVYAWKETMKRYSLKCSIWSRKLGASSCSVLIEILVSSNNSMFCRKKLGDTKLKLLTRYNSLKLGNLLVELPRRKGIRKLGLSMLHSLNSKMPRKSSIENSSSREKKSEPWSKCSMMKIYDLLMFYPIDKNKTHHLIKKNKVF